MKDHGNRLNVKVNVTNLTYDLDGKIEDAISYLNQLKQDNEGKQLYLSYEDVSHPYDDNDRMGIQVSYMRPETSDEYNKRIEREEASVKYRRDQYELLKKEFGDK